MTTSEHEEVRSTIDGIVTFIVSRRVKPGRETEFERWARGFIDVAKRYKGHIGVNVIRPADHEHPEYVIIFRFDNYEHLKVWQESEERQQRLAQIEPLLEGEPQAQTVSGFEHWFTPPNMPNMPPRYKQNIVSWLALVPLGYLLALSMTPLYDALGVAPLLRVMLNTAILVTLMTYVVMPRLTRVFARWLYGK